MTNHAVDTLLSLVLRGHKPCIDSREALQGDIFFALPGEQTNGNRFAKNALANGCRLAVVDESAVAGDNERFLLVDDVLDTLQKLSLAYRERFSIPCIGITGSNGKTTTKELMQAVFSRTYNSFATRGNLNNHIGVPLSLLSLEQEHQLAIIEMGANHKGEIASLCKLAKPTHGLITNIGKAHLEGFGSIEDVAKAKFELFNHLTSQNGSLFANHNDPKIREYAGEHEAVHYGGQKENHCSGYIVESSPFLHIRFRTNKGFGQASPGLEGDIKTRLTGAYNFENVMAALTTGLFFGVPAQDAADAIAAYQPANHRSQLIGTNDNTVIMDAYNANPTSMAAALDNYQHIAANARAVILGDMLELGNEAEKEHRQTIRQLEQINPDLTILVGAHFTEIAGDTRKRKVFPNVEEAGKWLAGNPLKGYLVLVKGSRGIKLEYLLKYL